VKAQPSDWAKKVVLLNLDRCKRLILHKLIFYKYNDREEINRFVALAAEAFEP
jgi:hypothetical protein